MMKKGILMVVSGFSGSGKGTVVKNLMDRFSGYALSVSVTTREPREGEIHGVHYFFIDQPEFDRMVREDELLEHAGYVGHNYGTPRSFVQKNLNEGMNVILEIEVQGALQIREKFPDAVLIFITPPSMEELRARLTGRGSETEDSIRGRLQRAREEADWMEQYDFILVNDQVEACAERLDHIREVSQEAAGRCGDFIREIKEEALDF